MTAWRVQRNGRMIITILRADMASKKTNDVLYQIRRGHIWVQGGSWLEPPLLSFRFWGFCQVCYSKRNQKKKIKWFLFIFRQLYWGYTWTSRCSSFKKKKKKWKPLCVQFGAPGHPRVGDVSQVTRLTDTNKRFILKFCVLQCDVCFPRVRQPDTWHTVIFYILSAWYRVCSTLYHCGGFYASASVWIVFYFYFANITTQLTCVSRFLPVMYILIKCLCR